MHYVCTQNTHTCFLGLMLEKRGSGLYVTLDGSNRCNTIHIGLNLEVIYNCDVKKFFEKYLHATILHKLLVQQSVLNCSVT
jgi:hypothetical protein